MIGVAQYDHHLVAVAVDIDHDFPREARRLDAVIDGIFQERLQHQRRNQRIGGHLVRVPRDLQAVAQPQLLDVQILAAEFHFLLQGDEPAVVGHQHPEQVSHILQRPFGALGFAADERQHGIQAVEQEMRPDARLQRL